MKSLSAVRLVFVALLVTGCSAGESKSSLALPSLASSDARDSWVPAALARRNLLYVGNFYTDSVTLYVYPGGRLAGTLRGFDFPSGVCSDPQGNVFITNELSADIVEYSHGGTSPIATFYDPGEYPVACAVDPHTDDLAVTSIQGASGPSGVTIYPHEQSSGQFFSDPSVYSMYFCGYDDHDTLYIDGENSSGNVVLAALSGTPPSFTLISLSQSISFPGGVQWDGKDLAVGDQDNNEVYEFSIVGSLGTLQGSTQLGGAQRVVGFVIPRLRHHGNGRGRILVGPDYERSDVGLWPYPAGGVAKKVISEGVDHPEQVAVSEGKM